MTAQDAYNIAARYWLDKEDEIYKEIIGWENKVREAVEEGKLIASISIISMKLSYGVQIYFEKLGYYVQFTTGPSPEHVMLTLWIAVAPYQNRGFINHKKFIDIISSISEE